MNSLRSYFDSFRQIWDASTPASRFVMVAVTFLCLASIVGVGIWSSQPQYVRVASDVDARKMNEIVAGLQSKGIEYQLSEVGNSLLVNKKDWAAANLVVEGIAPGFEEMPESNAFSGITLDPDARWNQSVREREVRIARALSKNRSIESAQVILNMPRATAFAYRGKKRTSASVTLVVRPNARLSNARAIAETVAKSVPNLDLSDISITDSANRIFWPNDAANGTNQVRDLIEERELSRTQDVLAVLTPTLGEENLAVSVSMEYDINERETNTTTVLPDPVLVKETITEQKTTEAPSSSAAGATANKKKPAAQQKASVTSSTTDAESSFEASKKTERTKKVVPELLAMSVSVNVNSAAIDEADPNALTVKEIEKMVKTALNFKEDRDSINVVLTTFKEIVAEPVVEAPAGWGNPTELIRNISLGVGAVVMFLITLIVIRKLRPTAAPPAAPQATSRQNQNLDQIATLIRSNPEAFSKIVSAWATNNPTDVKSSSDSRKAA